MLRFGETETTSKKSLKRLVLSFLTLFIFGSYYTVNMLLNVRAKVMEWCQIDYFHHKQYTPTCTLDL
jgi:hypothetical protein